MQSLTSNGTVGYFATTLNGMDMHLYEQQARATILLASPQITHSGNVEYTQSRVVNMSRSEMEAIH
jgi:hypothetical protein